MNSNMLATALAKMAPKKVRLVALRIDDRRIIWRNYAKEKGGAIVRNTMCRPPFAPSAKSCYVRE